jgi:hypothetical protein
MKDQVGKMQGQLKIMRADQRAWIAVKAIPDFIKENDPIIVHVQISNIGKTVAKSLQG